MTSWARPLGATLVAAGVVLATSWTATQVGKAIEGHTRSSAMSFDKLESNLVAVTLVALPLLSAGRAVWEFFGERLVASERFLGQFYYLLVHTPTKLTCSSHRV